MNCEVPKITIPEAKNRFGRNLDLNMAFKAAQQFGIRNHFQNIHLLPIYDGCRDCAFRKIQACGQICRNNSLSCFPALFLIGFSGRPVPFH